MELTSKGIRNTRPPWWLAWFYRRHVMTMIDSYGSVDEAFGPVTPRVRDASGDEEFWEESWRSWRLKEKVNAIRYRMACCLISKEIREHAAEPCRSCGKLEALPLFEDVVHGSET